MIKGVQDVQDVQDALHVYVSMAIFPLIDAVVVFRAR